MYKLSTHSNILGLGLRLGRGGGLLYDHSLGVVSRSQPLGQQLLHEELMHLYVLHHHHVVVLYIISVTEVQLMQLNRTIFCV